MESRPLFGVIGTRNGMDGSSWVLLRCGDVGAEVLKVGGTRCLGMQMATITGT